MTVKEHVEGVLFIHYYVYLTTTHERSRDGETQVRLTKPTMSQVCRPETLGFINSISVRPLVVKVSGGDAVLMEIVFDDNIYCNKHCSVRGS